LRSLLHWFFWAPLLQLGHEKSGAFNQLTHFGEPPLVRAVSGPAAASWSCATVRAAQFPVPTARRGDPPPDDEAR